MPKTTRLIHRMRVYKIDNFLKMNLIFAYVEKGFNKTLHPQNKIEWNTVIVPWSVSFTTLIYSTLKDSEDSRTVYLYDPKELEKKIDVNDENLFLGATFNLKQFKLEDMPSRYFSLRKGKYYLKD